MGLISRFSGSTTKTSSDYNPWIIKIPKFQHEIVPHEEIPSEIFSWMSSGIDSEMFPETSWVLQGYFRKY